RRLAPAGLVASATPEQAAEPGEQAALGRVDPRGHLGGAGGAGELVVDPVEAVLAEEGRAARAGGDHPARRVARAGRGLVPLARQEELELARALQPALELRVVLVVVRRRQGGLGRRGGGVVQHVAALLAAQTPGPDLAGVDRPADAAATDHLDQ